MIILVGLVGAVLAVYQFFYLATVRGKVRNQLKFPDAPETDNPLGRVLVTFKGEAQRLEKERGRGSRRAAHLRGGAEGSAEARAVPVLPADSRWPQARC